MDKIATASENDQQKSWHPENFRNAIGHFNVFRLEPFLCSDAKPVPYRKRDYFKIMLLVGQSELQFADKVFNVQKQALSFSNPLVPYTCEHKSEKNTGFFCIFNQNFFHQYGDLNQYIVFQPNGTPIFELSDEQVEKVTAIYERMLEEIKSDYIYKYDVLRTLVLELLHFAMKTQPSSSFEAQPINAAHRIALLFQELLERQFPIDETTQGVQFRSAADFAVRLNIHINHLNRAVKEITGKTTTQLIADRLLQEAKTLLRNTAWTVSEVGYALGYSEISHFNNFFKKQTGMSPLKFRNGL